LEDALTNDVTNLLLEMGTGFAFMGTFRGITTPMGVATYNNIRIKDMLPTQEQLKERMELLQKEIRAKAKLRKNPHIV